MYAKMNELGPVGGHAPGTPPRSANETDRQRDRETDRETGRQTSATYTVVQNPISVVGSAGYSRHHGRRGVTVSNKTSQLYSVTYPRLCKEIRYNVGCGSKHHCRLQIPKKRSNSKGVTVL